jgi:hypothetical protein
VLAGANWTREAEHPFAGETTARPKLPACRGPIYSELAFQIAPLPSEPVLRACLAQLETRGILLVSVRLGGARSPWYGGRPNVSGKIRTLIRFRTITGEKFRPRRDPGTINAVQCGLSRLRLSTAT